MQGDLGGLAGSAYKCVSLARLRSCTRVHSRRLASQSRISACNLASLDSAAAAAREVWRKTRYLGLSWLSEISRFFYIRLSVFAELAVAAVDFIAWVAFGVPMSI